MADHSGHRARVKERFLKEGLASFADHNILALLLFYAIPQRDVNGISHDLLDRFGSLSAVFDAPVEELMKVPYIGENAALLIKLVPQTARRYEMSRTDVGAIVTTSEEAGKYLLPRYFGETSEVVYLLCLDGKGKVLDCRLLFRGSVNAASVSVRKVVETAINSGSSSVILSHNHTSGIAVPSKEDKATTKLVSAALAAVGVVMADHIIVADGDFISMSDSGMLTG